MAADVLATLGTKGISNHYIDLVKLGPHKLRNEIATEGT